MIEFFQNNLAFTIFVILLSVFLYLKRKNLQISGSFPFLYMMMYRTKLGLDRMDKWSKKHPKIFLYLGYLSLIIGILGVFLTFIFMFWQLGFIVDNQISSGGGLVLPIQTDSGLDGAVPVFYVPFLYWIIALFILATVHEFAHGVIGERFGVKIKSSGFAFLGIFAPILPAAFVEPDEKSLSKKKWWQKISVFGAGSTSNFLFGFLFLAIWLFLAVPIYDKTTEIESISFSSVLNQSSLNNYDIKSGEIISLNGIEDKETILNEFSNLSINQSINLDIDQGGILRNVDIITYENNLTNKGMIGISGITLQTDIKEDYSYLGSLPIHFERTLFWIWFLNIGIGIMNLLPIWITDGGQIARELLLLKMKKKNALKAYNLISWISLILLIFTLYPSLLFSILGM